HLLDLAGSELTARRLPSEALVGIALDLDAAIDCFELIGLHAEGRRHRFEQLVESVDCGLTGGRGDSADGGGTTRSARYRERVVADPQLDRVEGQAQSFRRHLHDDGLGAGAEILAAQLYLDRSIVIDDGAAVAGVSAAAPSVDGQTQAALDRAVAALPARMPVLAPFGEFRCLLQLQAVDLGAWRIVGVLGEDFHRVHANFGGEILDGAGSDVSRLLVVGGAPGTLRARVDRYRGVVGALVW